MNGVMSRGNLTYLKPIPPTSLQADRADGVLPFFQLFYIKATLGGQAGMVTSGQGFFFLAWLLDFGFPTWHTTSVFLVFMPSLSCHACHWIVSWLVFWSLYCR
ncbi:hypothetical protein BDP81DRAFT_38105 [Colletotrichum phormii]|uniref:Uncharacterized protein n=1 Tax=Colletotrichum phormii TaxID=359342 RepID=A0AAI9ZRD9_9PEZI|nr:uncharacterized protein BDP81DRAFT_38105 [Colletotrichum phormii]KAK1635429.1 hypothetical protein BDP81DRAFT_38105 [Colletotrichum phormii]